jgi:hypothetical protein
MLINMYVDVAAYPGFCLFALAVYICVIVLDGIPSSTITQMHTPSANKQKPGYAATSTYIFINIL